MKKILSRVLAAAILLSFAGCGEKENEEAKTSSGPKTYTHSVNILAYAENGEIPEIPFKLGESIETVKTEFKDTVPVGSEFEDLAITEGEKTVQMDGGYAMFFYEKENASKGIGVIVAKEEAYKLSMGEVYRTEDVIEMIDSTDYKKETATDADVFFLPGDPSIYECLTYKAGNYILKFIILKGYVSAVTLTNPEIWNY